MLRCLARFVAVLGLAAAAFGTLQWLLPTPASAHRGVSVTVHSDGSGSVWTTVVWADGHPAQERVTALMMATTDGLRVGPVALQPVPGAVGTVAYAELLPAGRWHLAVDVALPAVGHCEADAVIGAGADPVHLTCAAPTPAPAGTAGAGQALGGGDVARGPGVWGVVGAIAAISGLAGVWAVWRQRVAVRPKR